MKNLSFIFAVLLAFVASSFTTPNTKPATLLASDYFLEIDGVRGESSAGSPNGTIEINSYSWDRTGKTVKIERATSPASASIKRLAEQGTTIPKAILHIRKAGSGQYMRYELKNVLVTSYQVSSSSARPSESFTLNYTGATF